MLPLSTEEVKLHVTFWFTFTDHFSGPDRAVGPLCPCSYNLAITFQRNVACWFDGQGHRSEFKVTG